MQLLGMPIIRIIASDFNLVLATRLVHLHQRTLLLLPSHLNLRLVDLSMVLTKLYCRRRHLHGEERPRLTWMEWWEG